MNTWENSKAIQADKIKCELEPRERRKSGRKWSQEERRQIIGVIDTIVLFCFFLSWKHGVLITGLSGKSLDAMPLYSWILLLGSQESYWRVLSLGMTWSNLF